MLSIISRQQKCACLFGTHEKIYLPECNSVSISNALLVVKHEPLPFAENGVDYAIESFLRFGVIVKGLQMLDMLSEFQTSNIQRPVMDKYVQLRFQSDLVNVLLSEASVISKIQYLNSSLPSITTFIGYAKSSSGVKLARTYKVIC